MKSSGTASTGEVDYRSHRHVVLFGALVTVAVTLCYFLLFWNRFAGLRSGAGDFIGGIWFLEGLRPYRDFYMPATPLTMVKSALVLGLFGKSLVVSRAFGVAERVLLAVLIYVWLQRLFRPGHAAAAAIVTIIASTADTADPLASYNHDTILLALLTGLIASYVIDQNRSPRSTFLLGLACGLSAGLCFLTKQTIGAAIVVAIPAIVSLWLWRQLGFRRAARFLVGFMGGGLLAALALLAWLAQLGLLNHFLSQVFVRGPAAKASHPGDFLSREIFIGEDWRSAIIAALVVLLASWRLMRRSALREEQHQESRRSLLFLLGAGILCVAVGAAFSYASVGWKMWDLLKFVIYLTLFASILLTLFYGIRLLGNNISWRECQFCLYSAVSFAVAVMLSLSFPAFEAMIVPGAALLVAALLDGARGWRPQIAVYLVCAVLVSAETCMKLNVPYSFADFNEGSVPSATSRSELPQLRGLRLPKDTVQFIDGTVRIVQENSTAHDTIFTYPEMGLFYPLTGRRCPTFSCSHNIDAVSDEFARQEAARLLSNKPAVLIYSRESPGFLVGQMYMWRDGKPSANPLALVAACETLAQQYRLAKTFTLSPGNRQIMVFVRPSASLAQK